MKSLRGQVDALRQELEGRPPYGIDVVFFDGEGRPLQVLAHGELRPWPADLRLADLGCVKVLLGLDPEAV